MPISLIPRLKPRLTLKEIFAAIKIFSRGNVELFEKEFAVKFENKYGVMFQHGRSGLRALFNVWNLENAEIICPAYTCVVVPHAIVLSGNKPVFVDCAEGSPNMSLDGIRDAITVNTRAVIVTHLFGYPMDVERVDEIVREAEQRYKHKIYVVQDTAHSFGCRWKGKLVTKSGDAAIFGLNISKTITSVFGGMVTTNSTELKDSLRKYRAENFIGKGIVGRVSRFIYLASVWIAFNKFAYRFVNMLENNSLLNRFVKYYDESKIEFPTDWSCLPSEIEARVGRVQLRKYDQIIKQRKKRALGWINELSDSDEITFFPDVEGSTYSHCVGLVENRDEWIQKFRKKGFQLGILIEYSVPYMKAYEKYAIKEYPVSKYYSEHTANFPISGV